MIALAAVGCKPVLGRRDCDGAEAPVAFRNRLRDDEQFLTQLQVCPRMCAGPNSVFAGPSGFHLPAWRQNRGSSSPPY
jgi:hypothetical protein